MTSKKCKVFCTVTIVDESHVTRQITLAGHKGRSLRGDSDFIVTTMEDGVRISHEDFKRVETAGRKFYDKIDDFLRTYGTAK